VTGGNSGIGLEAVKALSSAGCRVIIGSRSVEAGETAIAKEIRRLGLGGYLVRDASNIAVHQLDLESFPSVASFAEAVEKEPRIDYLILNAGIMAIPKVEYTENGWEKQIATNHFGHFHLSSLLLKKMKSQKHSSRVVTLASSAHSFGKITFDDMHYKKRSYTPWEAYGQSKAANVLFTKGLADRLTDSPVRALCLHPGVIKTNLFQYLDPVSQTVFKYIFQDKTVPQGAATTVYACLNPEFEDKKFDGSYLADCAVSQTSDYCKDASRSVRNQLWKTTEEQIQEALSKTKVTA
jgi:NAD(P)-dependent dehydrogenase (short-subunit alcohol dehydrogenase family)